MSFVSVVAREKFITIMSDGRVSNKMTKEILDENKVKFVKIGDNGFVAFAGISEICDLIVPIIGQLLESGHEFNDILTTMSKVLRENSRPGLFVTIAFGGINKNGNIEICSVENSSHSTTNFKPKGKEINYLFLRNPTIPHQELNQKFLDLIETNGKNTPTEFIKSQTILNSWVADRDSSVNKNITSLIIEKSLK